jgi:hypothetical protein
MTRYVALIAVFVIMLGVFVAGLGLDPRKLPSPLIDKIPCRPSAARTTKVRWSW